MCHALNDDSISFGVFNLSPEDVFGALHVVQCYVYVDLNVVMTPLLTWLPVSTPFLKPFPQKRKKLKCTEDARLCINKV